MASRFDPNFLSQKRHPNGRVCLCGGTGGERCAAGAGRWVEGRLGREGREGRAGAGSGIATEIRMWCNGDGETGRRGDGETGGHHRRAAVTMV